MTLTDRDTALLRLSVAICLGRWDVLRDVRRGASEPPDRAWREAVLQTHLFTGYPRVVEACRRLAEVGGLGAAEPEETGPAPEDFAAGRALFERIYAENAPAVREELETYHPALARWIEGHAYGRVLTRPGLSPARRELLSVACLAALGQERQLASHVRGAVLCGAEPREIREALEAVEDLVDLASMPSLPRILTQFAPE